MSCSIGATAELFCCMTETSWLMSYFVRISMQLYKGWQFLRRVV